MTGRVLRGGVALVALYVLVVIASAPLLGGQQRPLYEGFTPPPQYRWVDPPPAFRAGNERPHAEAVPVSFVSGKLPQAQPSTSDGQIAIPLPASAVIAQPGDTGVQFRFAPIAASGLPALPNGLYPDGNAYRVTMSHQPSGAPITTLAADGNVLMTVPVPGSALLFFDGQVWKKLALQPGLGPTTVGSTFHAAGVYLGAAPRPIGVTGARRGPSGFLIAVIALLVMVASFTVVQVVNRRRAAPPRRPPPRRPPAGRSPRGSRR
jgi:hypothetical protein